MPTLYLTDRQFDHVRRACLDYNFLGCEFDDEWTDDDEKQLRQSIFRKFNIRPNDSPYIPNHDNNCKCAGCQRVRNERRQIKKYQKGLEAT